VSSLTLEGWIEQRWKRSLNQGMESFLEPTLAHYLYIHLSDIFSHPTLTLHLAGLNLAKSCFHQFFSLGYRFPSFIFITFRCYFVFFVPNHCNAKSDKFPFLWKRHWEISLYAIMQLYRKIVHFIYFFLNLVFWFRMIYLPICLGDMN
jgi:hypothetical protein